MMFSRVNPRHSTAFHFATLNEHVGSDVKRILHSSGSRWSVRTVSTSCASAVAFASLSLCGCLRRCAPRPLRHAATRTPGRRCTSSRVVRASCPVLLLDPCSPGLSRRLSDLGCEVLPERKPDESIAEALVRGYPKIVVIRSSLLQDAELGAASDGIAQLGLVVRAGAGVDNIAVRQLQSKGTIVANAAGANAIAVAELTMAHLLNLDRRLSDQVESLRRGEWRRLEFAKGVSGLYSRTLAILGVGHIGREVAKRALAFGMTVNAWDPWPGARDNAAWLDVKWCDSPEEAVADANALSLHLSLTPATKGIVNKAILEKLSPGALVVNMSRGGVLDEAALLEAVEQRGLRAGLDVFEREPSSAATAFDDEAIRTSAHIYGTHHTGARTAQAAEAVEDAVVGAVAAFIAGDRIPGAIPS